MPQKTYIELFYWRYSLILWCLSALDKNLYTLGDPPLGEDRNLSPDAISRRLSFGRYVC